MKGQTVRAMGFMPPKGQTSAGVLLETDFSTDCDDAAGARITRKVREAAGFA